MHSSEKSQWKQVDLHLQKERDNFSAATVFIYMWERPLLDGWNPCQGFFFFISIENKLSKSCLLLNLIFCVN